MGDDCISDSKNKTSSYIEKLSHVTPMKKIEMMETDYGLSLNDAIEIQANAGAPPITSLYHHTPAFIDKSAIRFIQPTRLYGMLIDVKKEPANSSKTVYQFFGMSKVYINDIVAGEKVKGQDLWYEIAYQGERYYIHVNNILFPQAQVVSEIDVLDKPHHEAHTFGTLPLGEIFPVLNMENNKLQINYQYWRIPKKADIEFYLNPENGNVFQFVRLDEPTGVSSEQVDQILSGKGILDGHGNTFVEAAKKHQVNDAYLIAHSLLETGGGTSPLANGIEVGKNEADELELVTDTNRERLSAIKMTYNMYGIGAADSCPEECGAIRAYESGWFHPEEAIINGAKFVSEQYIYNEFSQNTLYKMKWNPAMKDRNEWKQYATDIGWAEKQTETIEAFYQQLDEPLMKIDLPVFE